MERTPTVGQRFTNEWSLVDTTGQRSKMPSFHVIHNSDATILFLPSQVCLSSANDNSASGHEQV